ncbi:MAG: shikimate kinase, partial [Patescibacteria group bacterium]
VLKMIAEKNKNRQIVLACGGGTPLDSENQILLRQLGRVIFLDVDEKILLPRILKHGVPAFFPYPNDPKKSLKKLLEKRQPIYEKIADKIINFKSESPETLVNIILTLIN